MSSEGLSTPARPAGSFCETGRDWDWDWDCSVAMVPACVSASVDGRPLSLEIEFERLKSGRGRSGQRRLDDKTVAGQLGEATVYMVAEGVLGG